MRKQVTAYLSSGTERWLAKYSKKHGLKRSELLRLLLQRERRVCWLSGTHGERNHTQHHNRKKREGGSKTVQPQVTVHIDVGQKNWLKKYANRLGATPPGIVRLLVEHEREVEWLDWALNAHAPPKPKRVDKS